MAESPTVSEATHQLPVKKSFWPKESPAKNDRDENALLRKRSTPEIVLPGLTLSEQASEERSQKKSVSQIARREIGGEAVCVNLFCFFVFCQSINVHLVYLLTYIFQYCNIQIYSFHLIMYVFQYLNIVISLLSIC